MGDETVVCGLEIWGCNLQDPDISPPVKGYPYILGYGDLGLLCKKKGGDTHCTHMLLRHILFFHGPDGTCFYTYIVFLIPLAEQKQIYVVWPITFKVAILYLYRNLSRRVIGHLHWWRGWKFQIWGCLWEPGGNLDWWCLVFVRRVNIWWLDLHCLW